MPSKPMEKELKSLIFALILLSSFTSSSSESDPCNIIMESIYKNSIGFTDQVARIKKYYPQGIAVVHSEEEVLDVVRFAQENKIQLSIKTGGFSQGGQWAIEKGIILDLSQYKGIKLNIDAREVIAKAGSTWKEIQALADKEGLATTVQQSSNIFPIGGALGMNAHGRDIEYGSIINVTNWIKVLLPNGKIVKASKNNEHSEIFRKVIGGLGLRGVILEASLKMRPNKIYETIVLENIPTHEIGEAFKLMRENPALLKKYLSKENERKSSIDFNTISPEQIGLGYGRAQNLNPNKAGYLNKAMLYMFVEVSKEKIKKTAKTGLKNKKSTVEHFMPLLMELQRLSHSVKSMREFLEKKFMRQTGSQASLNFLMDPPVNFLLFKQREESNKMSTKAMNLFKRLFRKAFSVPVNSTDALKEYFIPIRNVEQFKRGLSRVIKKYNLNNLNITYRVVPKTPDSYAPLINYAKEDMVAFVVNFNIGLSKKEREVLDLWSEELVEEALRADGVHYLAYEANATLDQLIRAYPGITKIFDEMLNEERPLFLNEYMKDYFEEYKKLKLLQ
jgi:decaprenylphospho-beta-D-ribofuranose 2-oxidase